MRIRIILALLSIFFINNYANASDFELTVYFNLGIAKKHGLMKCSQGGTQLDTEYHLSVFKEKPSYTILGNLDLNKNVAGDVERQLHCDEGEFSLRKIINTTQDFISLFIHVEEIYVIKDEIFDVANVRLSSDEDYFMQKKYISESGQTIIKKMNAEEVVSTKDDDPSIDNGDLLYIIEIKRK